MDERSTEPLEVLGQRVARAQDEWLADADALSEARRRLFYARPSTAINPWLVAAPAGALLAAAAALLVIFVGGTEPLTFEVGHASAEVAGGKVGEWIEVTEELPARQEQAVFTLRVHSGSFWQAISSQRSGRTKEKASD